ncbi:hypothetical protein [Altibacter sp.]|uniref:hypothetical protein n=1 Tax=Altibacter sp. TaxID=2024823 RepID=UPI0025BC4EEF|nr:hypothetical protein [Altibacter sp.]|tara:strand:+ start:9742 stop:10536 length:795 start_codon:yes stop_codon:yes gene_type:complete
MKKVVKHMKFTMNGKRLKEMINLCLLKGKYNQGLSNTKGQLGNCVKISCSGNKISVENGDASTYVRVYNRVRDTNPLMNKQYGFVNADILTKYLVDEDSTISFLDNIIKIISGNSVVEIPVIERHDYAHIIGKFSDSMQEDYEDEETYAATEKLVLKTKVCLMKNELISAINMAERVGSSIYTFNANSKGNTLSITSDKLTESITTNLEPISPISRDAIASFSLPISKALEYTNDDEVAIFYDDEMPIIFRTTDMILMRAPRTE